MKAHAHASRRESEPNHTTTDASLLPLCCHSSPPCFLLAALSHLCAQFFHDEDRHAQVRADAVQWLRANPQFYAGFLDQAEYPTWQSYIGSMARNFAWGDHLTLQAAAEVYNSDLVIVSSLPDLADKDAVTVVEPSKNVRRMTWRVR